MAIYSGVGGQPMVFYVYIYTCIWSAAHVYAHKLSTHDGMCMYNNDMCY